MEEYYFEFLYCERTKKGERQKMLNWKAERLGGFQTGYKARDKRKWQCLDDMPATEEKKKDL